MKEYITCAAIWYKELPTSWIRPKNIDSGLVICGHRHAHCIAVLKTLAGLRTVQFGPDSVGESVQGFMTNLNRFVERPEAMDIAVNAGQVEPTKLHNPLIRLFSEDLY